MHRLALRRSGIAPAAEISVDCHPHRHAESDAFSCLAQSTPSAEDRIPALLARSHARS